jgi:hypothetical protein
MITHCHFTRVVLPRRVPNTVVAVVADHHTLEAGGGVGEAGFDWDLVLRGQVVKALRR